MAASLPACPGRSKALQGRACRLDWRCAPLSQIQDEPLWSTSQRTRRSPPGPSRPCAESCWRRM
uniref:Uncharacterized protein n=1 Tax=uncultured marine virus TaxID=186617 RepID=A0A0F7L072_9VIRU|nr:hypothetical protein [uncultured marine virus]